MQKEMVSLKEWVIRMKPDSLDIEKDLEAFGTAWRRGKTKGLPLGEFNRKRNDLSDFELSFLCDWCRGKQTVETATTPVKIKHLVTERAPKTVSIDLNLLNDLENTTSDFKEQLEKKLDQMSEKEPSRQDEKKESWMSDITAYDIVNISSNMFAGFSFVNMLGILGVFPAAILILSFWGIISDLKKEHRQSAAGLGIFGTVIIESIYAFVHNTFFMDLLKGKEHLPCDYRIIATGFAIIIACTSIFAALMTRMRAKDDAEKKYWDNQNNN